MGALQGRRGSPAAMRASSSGGSSPPSELTVVKGEVWRVMGGGLACFGAGGGLTLRGLTLRGLTPWGVTPRGLTLKGHGRDLTLKGHGRDLTLKGHGRDLTLKGPRLRSAAAVGGRGDRSLTRYGRYAGRGRTI